LGSVPSFGEEKLIVEEISIQGNCTFSKQELLKQIKTKPKLPFNQEVWEEDIRSILRFYQNSGFLFTRIEQDLKIKDSRVKIKIIIDETYVIPVGKIELSGNHAFPTSSILKRMETKKDRIFKRETFEEDLQAILSLYENNGYPYCRVEPQNFQVDKGRLNFSLKVVEGPRVRIAKVEVVGNELTKDYVIRREMGIREGEFYCQERIDQAKKRLEELGIFKKVGEVEATLDKKEEMVTLTVPIEEGRVNTLRGGLSISPEGRGINGEFDLDAKNLMGTGRRGKVKWSRISTSTTRFKIGFEEPWLFKRPYTLKAELFQSIEDSTYTFREGMIYLSLPLSQDLSLVGGWGKEQVLGRVGRGNIYPSIKTKGILGVRWKRTDSVRNPSQGLDYDLSFEVGRKKSQLPSSKVETMGIGKLRYDLANYLPLPTHHVFALLIHGRKCFYPEEEVPISEQFRIGGATSLRGYREEQFYGTDLLWFNLEYRILFLLHSRIFMFFDLGHLEAGGMRISILTRRAWKLGYGAGLRLSSRLGMVSLSYGLGEGDGILGGKLHLSLENEF